MYGCWKELDHPELGEFRIAKTLTLEGAPYVPINYVVTNGNTWLHASWSTTTEWRIDAPPGHGKYDYFIAWTNESAMAASADADVVINFYWPQPDLEKWKIRLARKSEAPGRGNSGIETEYYVAEKPNAAGVITVGVESGYLSRKASAILALAGKDNVLTASVYDESGRAHQSLDLNIQELRDGLVQMRKLLVEFETETADFRTACHRDRDALISVMPNYVRVTDGN